MYGSHSYGSTAYGGSAGRTTILKVLTESLNVVGSKLLLTGRIVFEQFNIVGNYEKVLTSLRTFIESFTASDIFSKVLEALKTLSETITATGSKVMQTGKTFIETLAAVSSFEKVLSAVKTLLESIVVTPISEYLKTFLITFGEVFTVAGQRLAQVSRTLIESLTVGSAKILNITKVIIETFTVSSSKVYSAIRTLIENFVVVPVYEKVWTLERIFTETVVAVGSILRSTGRVLVEIVTANNPAVDLLSIFNKTISETINIVSAMGSFVIGKLFIQPFNVAGSLANVSTFYKILSEVMTIGSQIVKQTGRIFKEIINVSEDLAIVTNRIFSEAVKVYVSMINQTERSFIEAITVGSELIKNIGRIFNETVNAVLNFVLSSSRAFAENVQVGVNMVNQVARSFIETVVVELIYQSVLSAVRVFEETLQTVGSSLNLMGRSFTENINISQLTLILKRFKVLIENVAVVPAIIFQTSRTFIEAVVLNWAKETYRAFIFSERVAVRVIFMPFTIGKLLVETIIGSTLWEFGKTQFIVLTDNLQVVLSFLKVIARTFTQTVKMASDVIIKYIGRFFEEGIMINPSHFQDEIHLLYGRVLSEIFTATGALGGFVIGKLLPEIVKIFDNITSVSTLKKVLEETIVVVGNIVFNTARVLSESIAVVSDALRKLTSYKILVQIVKMADLRQFRKTQYKVLIDHLKAVSASIRATGRVFIEAFTAAGTLGNWAIGKLFIQPFKVFDDNKNVWQLGRLYSETVKVADSVISQTGRFFAETIAVAGTFVLGTISKLIIEIVKIAEYIEKSLPARVFSEAFTVAGNAFNQAGKIFVETLQVAGTFILGTISKLLIEIVNIAETFVRTWTLARVFSEVVKVAWDALNEAGLILKETLGVAGTFILGTISKVLTEIVKIAYSAVFAMTRVFEEIINVSDDLIMTAGKIFSEVFNVVNPVITKLTGKTFTAVVLIGTSLKRTISRIFTQALNVAGQIYQIGTSFILYEVLNVAAAMGNFAIGKLLKETVVATWAKVKLVLNGIQVGLWGKIPRVTGVWGKVARVVGGWHKISRDDT